ncbi:MAG: non-homologous end-joining DNA ligase [Stellaceae bacterium]
MAFGIARRRRSEAVALPQWVRPQLTELVDAAPEGDDWLHEIKYDGYRMHARLDHGAVQLLTRTGLDWTHKYPATAKAVAALGAQQAYLDGELCGVGPGGITTFSIIQAASDAGNAAALVFYLFDLLHLDGEDLGARPLIDRKERLGALLAHAAPCLYYSDHVIGQGPAFYEQACKLSVEGIVSKRIDAPYTPANRGLWRKVKCLNREEFVVVGGTDPEGRRPRLGALLLGYYDPDGRLIYAGRAGTGLNDAELERLWRRLQPLAVERMPLDVPPPRTSRFGSPLVLSRVHWVRPELVAEVKYLTWTEDNLLRQVVYEGLREDKPAAGVRREVPHQRG